jgi:hypothetical protein
VKCGTLTPLFDPKYIVPQKRQPDVKTGLDWSAMESSVMEAERDGGVRTFHDPHLRHFSLSASIEIGTSSLASRRAD